MRKIFSIFLTILIVNGTVPAGESLNVFNYSSKTTSFSQKLTRIFRFSLQKENVPYIWICYQIGESFSLPTRFNSASQDRESRACLADMFPLAENDKPVFLLKFYLQSGRPRLLQIEVLNLHDKFNFKNIPLFWLGKQETRESFSFLTRLLSLAKFTVLQKSLISALSFHNVPQSYLKLTRYIFKQNLNFEIKAAALYGLRNFSHKECLAFLYNISTSSQQARLKNIAIHALGINHHPEAETLLLGILNRESDLKIKKQAIFWLSQKGTEKAAGALIQILYQNENLDLKKFSIFALSQMPNNMGKKILQNVLDNNPEADIRNSAAFWLRNSENDHAINFLQDYFETFNN